MARPSENSLVAVSFQLPLRSYLTVTDFQRQVRFLTDLVTILAPPGRPQEDKYFVAYRRPASDLADRLRYEQQAYELVTGDLELTDVDPDTVSRVLRSQAAAEQRRTEARQEEREPSFRQLIGRRRSRTQRQLEVTDIRYGSDLHLTVQTAYVDTAFALVVLTYLFTMISNARRIASDNNAAVNMNRLRNDIIEYVRVELPHMRGDEADPGLVQVTDLLFRLAELKQVKTPSAALFPDLPNLPNGMSGLQLPGAESGPAALPPGESPQP